MNIIFVCSEYPYTKKPTGGFGTYVHQISKELIKHGHKVIIIVLADEKRQIYKKNITIFAIRPFGYIFLNKASHYFPFLKRAVNFLLYPILFSLSVHQKLKSIEKRGSIDVVEGGDFGAELFFYLLFRKKKYSKVVVKLHTPSFVIQRFNNEKVSLFYKTMYFLEGFCIRKADCLYSPSKSLASLVSREYSVKVESVIPYPFVTKEEKIKKIKRKKNMILFVGKLQQKKGIFTLVKSIKVVLQRFPDTQFIFVGSDTKHDNKSAKKRLVKMLSEFNISHAVKILNPLSQEDIYKLYQQVTMTVVPSIWENFPNVVLEAMNFGSVVIGSDVGGIPEIIKHKRNGYLVKPENVKELADAIALLLRNHDLRQRLTSQAKKDLRLLCDPLSIVRQTIKFYEEI